MAGDTQHVETLKQALQILKDRSGVYNKSGGVDGVEESFTRAAAVASLWLDRKITPRDVALIMASVKIARTAVSNDHQDSYVDLINYVSFGASFSAPKANGKSAGSQPQTAADLSALNQRADYMPRTLAALVARDDNGTSNE